MEFPSNTRDFKVVGNRLVVCHSEAVHYKKPLSGSSFKQLKWTHLGHLKIVDLVFLHPDDPRNDNPPALKSSLNLLKLSNHRRVVGMFFLKG